MDVTVEIDRLDYSKPQNLSTGCQNTNKGRKPKKQHIRAGGISTPSSQATRGCAARCRGLVAFLDAL